MINLKVYYDISNTFFIVYYYVLLWCYVNALTSIWYCIVLGIVMNAIVRFCESLIWYFTS